VYGKYIFIYIHYVVLHARGPLHSSTLLATCRSSRCAKRPTLITRYKYHILLCIYKYICRLTLTRDNLRTVYVILSQHTLAVVIGVFVKASRSSACRIIRGPPTLNPRPNRGDRFFDQTFNNFLRYCVNVTKPLKYKRIRAL